MNPEVTTRIFVCTHKQYVFPDNDNYFPLQVGKALSKVPLSIQGDDSGINISARNANYCELTGLYWIWKNQPTIPFIGLCHYRRYFDFNTSFLKRRDSYSIIPQELSSYPLSIPDLTTVFKKYDIILPKPISFPGSIRLNYLVYHIKEDLDILGQVIYSLTPEYTSAFEQVMNQSNQISTYNMFLAPRTVMEGYCEWLFKILFETEKHIKISAYPYQSRVFGFLSERLLNVYCKHHKLKIKYYPVLYLEETPSKQCSWIYYLWKKIKFRIIFLLMKS